MVNQKQLLLFPFVGRTVDIIAVIFCCAAGVMMLPVEINGFVPTPTTIQRSTTGAIHGHPLHSKQLNNNLLPLAPCHQLVGLRMMASREPRGDDDGDNDNDKGRISLLQHQQHPSHEEQLALLKDAVELRRLKKVQEELMISLSARIQNVPKLMICRSSGYGDDLYAYETALERGQEAREALITRNMGLVHYCVKNVAGTKNSKKRVLLSLSIEDLVQEGAIGLSRAVDKWNPDIGGRFSTYAVYWIRAAVLRGIAERDDLVRVPVHVTSSVRKMKMAAKQIGLDLDDETSLWKEAKAAKQLAEAAGLSDADLERAIQVQRRRSRGGIISFETWMQKGLDLETDHGSMAAGSSAAATATASQDLDYLRTELSKFLRPKEVEALSWRYGLLTLDDSSSDSGSISNSMSMKENNTRAPREERAVPVRVTQGKWGEAMSFLEVGKRMHVSAEYGRRLCQKALSKLRLAHEQGRLEPALLSP